MDNTRIPLRVKFIPNSATLEEPFEKGVLYFVEAQNTIYKDGIIPFGGINNVSFEKDGNVTKISFSTNNSTQGDAGTIVVSNSDLSEYVERIASDLDKVKTEVADIEFSTSNIYNLDIIAPSVVPYNLKSAIDYISKIDIADVKNTGIVFNDGEQAQLYFYAGTTPDNLNNAEYWVKVTTGEERIQHYKAKTDFPAIGKVNFLYIDDSSNEMWYWNDNNLVYKQCGFDPLNITFIDSNF